MLSSLFSLKDSASRAVHRPQPPAFPAAPLHYVAVQCALAREKVVLTPAEAAARGAGSARPTAYLFTRLRMQFRSASELKYVTFLGQRATTLLRAGAQLAQAIKTAPSLFHTGPTTQTQWAALWQASLEKTFEDHHADQWFRAYVDGSPVYAKSPDAPLFDMIEKTALGADLSDQIVRDSVEAALGGRLPAPPSYYGQAYVAITTEARSFRSAIIERKAGANHSRFIQSPLAVNAKPQNFARVADFTADVVEALVLRAQYLGIKAASPLSEGKNASFLSRVNVHRSLLQRRISAFESVWNIHYRPERPVFD